MKRFYCVICSKYRKLEKPKISYLLEKTLVLSIICSNCKNEDEKITSNINKTELEWNKNELKKLKTFDSSLFIGRSYFNEDGIHLYLVFPPIYKTITKFSGLPNIISE